MDFKLLMSAYELFKGAKTLGEKQTRLIAYGKFLREKLGRDLNQNDFKVPNRVSYATILSLFDGSLKNYYKACGFSYIRPKNLADDELFSFIKETRIETEKGCWESPLKAKGSHKRTRVKYKGKLVSLYKLAFLLSGAALNEGEIILHSCDNAKCFNPAHLSAGTYKQNTKEAAERGLKSGKRPFSYKKQHGIVDPYNYEAILNFVKQYITVNTDDAWIYAGNENEYPCIMIGGRKYMLHRLILANKLGKAYEEIDIARHVLPSGNKPSKRDINPEHLFEGDILQNSLDTVSYNKMYKLSFVDATRIRDAAKQYDFSIYGNSMKFDRHWANEFNVKPCTIRNIRKGRNWDGLHTDSKR